MRQAERPERVVFGVGLVGMLLLTVGYFSATHVARSVSPLHAAAKGAAPSVEVLSARRTPANLSNITRIGALTRAMASFSSRVPSQSCSQVDWLGHTVLNVNSNLAVTPASSTKVITASVALAVLGPQFTYETRVKTTTTPTGAVVDNLYFIGGGDPLLSRNEYIATEKYPTIHPSSLEALADKIVASGIRQVTGSIVVDDSRYDTVRFVDVWPQEFHYTESGPLGALSVDDGVVLGQNVKPDDPALAAATELRSLLATRGVLVANDAQRGVVPATSHDIATLTSAPLTDVISEMLTNSDNNTAELLLKEIGFAAKKTGSTVAGLQTVQEYLTKWQLGGQIIMNDGSGLSANNKIPCSAFMSLLQREEKTLPGLMAVAGVSGTIRDAFDPSPVKGRLVGKTGTLNGVKALVGYLPLDGEEPVVYSLLLHQVGIDNMSAYRPIWNALGDALNKARATPRPDQLVP